MSQSKKQEKIWGILMHRSMNYTRRLFGDTSHFEEKAWNNIIQLIAESGANTIILDLCDGIEFGSHPEIALKDAWTRKQLREELKKLKSMGISVVPKINFSTTHADWMGEYARMVSTKTYYNVCRDLIYEAYDLFDGPQYIHLGMDEEDAKHNANTQHVVFRQGELYWHDLRFLMDCVIDKGATPWIWSCALFDHPEEYKKYIGVHDAVLSPWYYNAFRKEHYTPIESRAEYVAYYNEGDYAKMGLKYVEEDPFLVNFRNVALPLMKEGYRYVPCASTFNKCPYNTMDLVEYFKDNAPDEQVLGFMTAPWTPAMCGNEPVFEESLRLLQEAREMFYGK